MTHWTKITTKTRDFTDASYMELYTPPDQLLSTDQKEKIEVKRKKKEEDEKARRYRDMEEHRRSRTL